MKNIIVYPKNEKQKNLLQSLLEEMKVKYIIDKSEKNALMTQEEFFVKIDSSIQQAENGEMQHSDGSHQRDEQQGDQAEPADKQPNLLPLDTAQS